MFVYCHADDFLFVHLLHVFRQNVCSPVPATQGEHELNIWGTNVPDPPMWFTCWCLVVSEDDSENAEKDNRNLVDGSGNQKLSRDDIEAMKKGGVEGHVSVYRESGGSELCVWVIVKPYDELCLILRVRYVCMASYDVLFLERITFRSWNEPCLNVFHIFLSCLLCSWCHHR